MSVCLCVCVTFEFQKLSLGRTMGECGAAANALSIDDEGGAALIFPVRSERKMLNRGGQMGGKAGTWIAQRPNI